MIQTSKWPHENEVKCTGSERIPSHLQTKGFDTASNISPWAIAHADIKVVKIDRQANSVWFTTKSKVIMPIGTDVLTNRMAHMNDADFDALGMKIGREFKQGERCYKQGNKFTTLIHIHNECGLGQLQGEGWYETGNGNYTINTTGGSIHMWEAFFVSPELKIIRYHDGKSPQDAYSYQLLYPLMYQLHVQNRGNMELEHDGLVAGTVGFALRSEAVRIICEGITYRTHIQNRGWGNPVESGMWDGSMGMAYRLEAIRIQAPVGYEIIGQAHVANIGWMPEQRGNTIEIGTTGKSLAIEAIRLALVKV